MKNLFMCFVLIGGFVVLQGCAHRSYSSVHNHRFDQHLNEYDGFVDQHPTLEEQKGGDAYAYSDTNSDGVVEAVEALDMTIQKNLW